MSSDSRSATLQRQKQLDKAIARLQELASEDRLCRCDQCKAIRDVLKAWRIKP